MSSTPPSDAPRIACLVPSLTLLLVQLGLRPWLVARTGFCIHPADQLGDVPKVGGTKDLRWPALQAAAPTDVLVNVDENRLDDVHALEAAGFRVRVTHPCGPDDHPALLDQLAHWFGHLPGVRAQMDRQREAFARARAGLASRAWPHRRVLCLIWRQPWMTVARDTYISRLLACAGWQTWPPVEGGAHGAARYPVLQGDEPWLADIEEVLLPSEPYAFGAAHAAEVQALCPRARLHWVDGEALSWHGGMALEGLALVECLALHAR